MSRAFRISWGFALSLALIGVSPFGSLRATDDQIDKVSKTTANSAAGSSPAKPTAGQILGQKGRHEITRSV
jgi:hypothetical protein